MLLDPRNFKSPQTVRASTLNLPSDVDLEPLDLKKSSGRFGPLQRVSRLPRGSGRLGDSSRHVPKGLGPGGHKVRNLKS